jgi:hypothetical protein
VKALTCQCGQTLFCNNTQCGACGRLLGFEPELGEMLSLDTLPDNSLVSADGTRYQLCANRRDYQVCNGVVASATAKDAQARCSCCALNRTIPDVSRADNLIRWRLLEQAKRRMITGLYSLGLDVETPPGDTSARLRFDFLEDKRSHPGMREEYVSTGHHQGVVTINVLEADEVQRVWQRETSSERYRTLLGHFRHEVGHYFYFRLPVDIAKFTALFGDPNQDYDQALQNYYESGAVLNWEQSFISAYASSHPLEDWAECFAHYLHMLDALETAVTCGVLEAMPEPTDFDKLLLSWMPLAVKLNEMNHSLGLGDAYPFLLPPPVGEKLAFIHNLTTAARIS